MPLSKIESAGLGAGAVLQVVQTMTSTTTTTSATSYVDATDLTVSITPKFATSKILITAVPQGIGNTTGYGVRLMKNGSVLFNPSPEDATGPYYVYIGGSILAPAVLEYLDSPATTSTLTYSIQFRAYAGTAAINYSSGGVNTGKSTITVMEIAA